MNKKTLGYLLVIIGIVVFAFGFIMDLNPNLFAEIVVDDTVPLIMQTYPTTAGSPPILPSTFTQITVRVQDLESGITTVKCTIDTNTAHICTYSQTNLDLSETWIATPAVAEMSATTHTIRYDVTNGVGLTTTISGTYVISSATLSGSWYVNNVLITSPSQVVKSQTLAVSFKFVETSGITDSSITCTIVEGGATKLTLTNSASNTWTGTYTFTRGTHTLELTAQYGTQKFIMSYLTVSFDQFEIKTSTMIEVVGGILTLVGVGMLLLEMKGVIG